MMSRQDGELEELRTVSCAALLERLPPSWQLDKTDVGRHSMVRISWQRQFATPNLRLSRVLSLTLTVNVRLLAVFS